MIEESIQHKARGKKYRLQHKSNQRYPGGSEYALTDGFLGSLEFTDESWMGFHGDNVEIFIDLEQITEISSIEISFLRNQASWIFLPEELEILAGNDPRYFNPIYRELISSKEKDLNILKYKFVHNEKLEAQFLKIIVHNMGKCPDWHPGKGERAWLFVDEVIIK